MKVITVDGKKVMYFNNKKTVPPVSVIKNTYKQIPDNKKVPIIFMTREQYLKQYTKNQEQAKNINFPKVQEQQYIRQEMPFYNNVLSRYTTKNNKFFKPAVVFFNDKKIGSNEFKYLAFHEYGHELVEKKKKKLPLQKEEQFCDKFAFNLLKKFKI